jgi:hypothetical protein
MVVIVDKDRYFEITKNRDTQASRANRFPLHNPSPEKIPGKIDADREFVNNSIN